MAGQVPIIAPALQEYVEAHSTPPDEVVRDLVDETRRAVPERFGMQITPDQATFLTLVAKLVGARRAVEVGTFTGLSALAIARGMAPDGSLLCCDLSDEWTAIGRRFWERAGVADRIELRIAPAIETLRRLPAEPHLDLTFIDADKTGYLGYWEEIVPRTRPGGVILVDNVLWSGRVIDPGATDPDTEAIREFNERVAADDRTETVVLPVADGVTVSRRR